MRLVRVSTGEPVTARPEEAIGAGGEARIVAIAPDDRFAAKLYHRPSSLLDRKLSAMIANPPDDPMAGSSHISIAWPLDTLATDGDGSQFVGYLMPRVTQTLPVFQYYNPASRRIYAPAFTYQYLLRAARNTAAAVRALHLRGYVIGDLNESNVLVTQTALVTLVDTDSFQVPDSDRRTVYRCTVGKPEYTPPELAGKSFSQIDRRAEHDLFGLGVLIFQLLMEGVHPFAGVYSGDGDPPPYEDRIAAGDFPYAEDASAIRPLPGAPDFEILSPALRALFRRCFEEGHKSPAARPDAGAWLAALNEAEDSLTTCTRNPRHLYGSHLTACPWCERRMRLGGADPFPATEAEARQRRIKRKSPGMDTTPTAPINAAATLPVTFPSQPSSPPKPLPAFLHFPNNRWSWITLAAGIFAIFAYGLEAPFLSLGITVVGGCSLFMAHTRKVRSVSYGAWLAKVGAFICAAAAVDSGLDARDIVFPPAYQVIHQFGGVRSAGFSRDGNLLITGTNRVEDQRLIGGQLEEWDARTAKPREFLGEYAGNVTQAIGTPDQKNVLAATYSLLQGGTVELIDSRYGDSKTTLLTTSSQPCISLAPDAASFAVGELNGSVRILDMKTHATLRHITIKGEVLAITYSPDGAKLAVATGSPPGSVTEGTLTLLRSSDLSPIWTAHAHSSAILTAVFAKDGKMLLTGGNDGSLNIWSVSEGGQPRSVPFQTERIAAIATSPRGDQIAVGLERSDADSQRYQVALVAWPGGDVIRTLSGHRNRITSLAYAPDGRKLASASLDSTVRLWRLR